MRKIACTIVSFLCSYICCFGQQLRAQAVFYDELNNLYKVERKYERVDNIIYYIKHTDQGSVGIKWKKYKNKDTTIIQTDYCNIEGHFPDGSANNARGRVRRILISGIDTNFNSFRMQEVVRSYYRKDKLVKIERSGSNMSVYQKTEFNYNNRGVICRRFNVEKNQQKLYRTDRVSWNEDTSVVDYNMNSLNFHYTGHTRYAFSRNRLLMSDTSIIKEIVYAKDFTFDQLLADRTIYDDPLYIMELLLLDRERMISQNTPNGQSVKHDYTENINGQIKERISYVNGIKNGKVIFSYK